MQSLTDIVLPHFGATKQSMKKKKEIDWEEVDKEFGGYFIKCAELDKQIAEERKKTTTIEDLVRANEEVVKFCEENGISYVTLEKEEE